MKMTRLFAAAFVALLLCASHAKAADAQERFLLTPALLAKMKAAAPDIRKLGNDEHGLNTREFALGMSAFGK